MSFVGPAAPTPTRNHLRSDKCCRPFYCASSRFPTSLRALNHPSVPLNGSEPAVTPFDDAPDDDDDESIALQEALLARTAPVVTETLAMLDWPQLSARVASFASTRKGHDTIASPALDIPPTRAESEMLLSETAAVVFLERDLRTRLDFSGIHDVEAPLRYAAKGGTCTVEELLQIASTLSTARRLRAQVVDAATPATPAPVQDPTQSSEEDAKSPLRDNLRPLLRTLEPLSTFAAIEKRINGAIDDGALTLRDSASTILREIRANRRDAEQRIRDILADIVAKRGEALQDKVVTTRDDRLVLAVKAGSKTKVPGVVHDTSATGATLYIEPRAAADVNAKLRRIRKSEEEEIERILGELSALVGEVADGIQELLRAVTKVDAACARARHGMALGAVRPRFVGRRDAVRIRGVRHPLLVWREIDNRRKVAGKRSVGGLSKALEEVVPADFVLGKSVRCAIITGPNTGGKTISLKSFAVASLMARAGVFLLSDDEDPEVPFFDLVLADIGDDQSITQSLSTFSGHIERVKRILNAATEESLVVLDEVGSGTDPAEGSALGIALLRVLASKVRLTFASTHHGELKTLKYMDPDGRFENASMEFNDEKMRPTFRLIWGIPGRSNALAIAERLGLDKSIVEAARSSLSGTSIEDVNVVITALEKQRAEAENDGREVRRTLEETRKLKEDAEKQLRALKHSEEELKRAKEKVLQQELSRARDEVASVVRKMQSEGTSQAAQRARQELIELTPSTETAPRDRTTTTVFIPKQGDRVKIGRLGETPVEVISHTPGKSEVVVGFGAMKVRVSIDEITSLEGKKATKPARIRPSVEENTGSTSANRIAIRHMRNTCDVRGMMVDEAITRVDDTLAATLQFGACWIVHGHGATGALRKGVRAHLRRHPNVDRFEDAEQRDGGTGATLVYLK